MYLQHFSLKEFPFTITPDTGFFMNRAGYQDALNVLLIALRSGEGFVKVTGEVGVGKTILCRKLLKTLGKGFVTAYIQNPYLQPETLIFAIADELSVKYPQSVNQHTLLKLITRYLIHYHKHNKKVVLCIDEAQAMPVETMETLRLISNIETEKRKLIQVVMFGQPELDVLLEQPSVRQLKQRITFSYKLLPLNRVALEAYIRHRLVIAGYHGDQLFTRGTFDQLYAASNGIPRLINILCHKALLSAYGQGTKKITAGHVKSAINDTLEAQRIKRSRLLSWLPLRWLYGAFGLLLVISTSTGILLARGLLS